VYPPCDTKALRKLPLKRAATTTDGGRLVFSLAQFRPEKDHAKQLHAFARFLKNAPQHAAGGNDRERFIVAGGCRGEGDKRRLHELHMLCSVLGLCVHVEGEEKNGLDWDVRFSSNIPFLEVQALLGKATVGLHTMQDEHFGISVVEFMAAGAVVLAHNSAGPAMDIVTPTGNGQRTGFLATDVASYAAALQEIFALSEEERLKITEAARESVTDRFSEQTFENTFVSGMVGVLRFKKRGAST